MAPSADSHKVTVAVASMPSAGTTIRKCPFRSSASPPGVAIQMLPLESSNTSKIFNRARGSGGTYMMKRPSCIRIRPPRAPTSRSPLRASRIA